MARSTLVILALALFAVAHGAPATREELGERAEELAATRARPPLLPNMKEDFAKLVELRKEAGGANPLGKPSLKEGIARLTKPVPHAMNADAMEKLSKFAKGAEKRKGAEKMLQGKMGPEKKALPEGFKAPPAFKGKMGAEKKALPEGFKAPPAFKGKRAVDGAPLLGADKATWSPNPLKLKPEAPHKAAKLAPHPPTPRERSVPTPPPKRAAPRDAPMKAPHMGKRATTAPAEVLARAPQATRLTAAEKKLAPKGPKFEAPHKALKKLPEAAPAAHTEIKAKLDGFKAKKITAPQGAHVERLKSTGAGLKEMDVTAFKAQLHASLDRIKAQQEAKEA